MLMWHNIVVCGFRGDAWSRVAKLMLGARARMRMGLFGIVVWGNRM